jgi:bifunctional oligoribonuclease and PAP phosphatase NrnA
MSELFERIAKAGSIAVAGHVRPDGDSVGSCLGLRNYIIDNYPDKKVDVYIGDCTDKFSFMRGFNESFRDPRDMEGKMYDLFVSLDTAQKSRLGDFTAITEHCRDSYCVDHHDTSDQFTNGSIVDPRASSTCEILYGLMDPGKVNKETAECLYTGIVHDTGVFQYSCTSKKTMDIAGSLIELGIDFPWIVSYTFFSKTVAQQRILGYSLEKAQLDLDGQYITCVITKQEQEEFGVTPIDLDSIVARLRETDGVRVTAFYYQLSDGMFKCSLRSSDGTDVSRIAQNFGGGGHVHAAGFETGDLEKDAAKLRDYVMKELL